MNRTLATALITTVALTSGCGESSTAARSFDSPDAVFSAFQESTKAEDWPGAARCLTAESQAMLADGMIIAASFQTAGDSAKEQDLKAILKRHGIDLDAALSDEASPTGPTSLAASAKDKSALLADVWAWLKKNGKNGGGPDLRMDKLTDVKAEGDQATALADTSRGQRPIEFRRVDGGWLIHLPSGRS
jgi:hypothetical protein